MTKQIVVPVFLLNMLKTHASHASSLPLRSFVLRIKTLVRLLAASALLIAFSTGAGIIEGGRGMLFGADHAFAVTATSEWVLDNQSGIGQGLYMVFYPKSETWPNSPVIIYGRAISTAEVADIKMHVEKTVREFRKDGNPNYSTEQMPPLPLPNGQKAAVYFYSGDQWGNHEAAVYFQEPDTINYLVFNSSTKEYFDKYIGDFMWIASSYQNLYTPAATVTRERLDELRNESSAALEKPGGKEYESTVIQTVGEMMATVMGDCTAYLHGDEIPEFSYFVRINNQGGAIEWNIYPTNELSVCFSGLMSSAHYPSHTFESFLLNIEMKFAP